MQLYQIISRWNHDNYSGYFYDKYYQSTTYNKVYLHRPMAEREVLNTIIGDLELMLDEAACNGFCDFISISEVAKITGQSCDDWAKFDCYSVTEQHKRELAELLAKKSEPLYEIIEVELADADVIP